MTNLLCRFSSLARDRTQSDLRSARFSCSQDDNQRKANECEPIQRLLWRHAIIIVLFDHTEENSF
jgi:hypothetical protein